MQNTVFGPDNTVQYMVFQPGDVDFKTGLPIPDDLLGQPKGLKRVLQERGLWRPKLKKQCGRVKKAATVPDAAVESEEEMLARTLDQCLERNGYCALRIMVQEPD